MAASTQLQQTPTPATDAVPVPAASDSRSSGLSRFIGGLSDLSMIRQIGLMAGLAASVAIGLGIILWSQEPEYRPIGTRDPKEVTQLISFLDKEQFQYKLDKSGTLLVPVMDYQAINLKMAAQGIDPWKESKEDDYLSKDTGFAVSQKLEVARLQRARETELARTIMEIGAVKTAKVHLALPRESIFARDQKDPTASVLLGLQVGRRLSQEEIDTIVNLVASSVPGLSPNNVTLVDHKGRLLNAGGMSALRGQSRIELEIEQQREDDLRTRVTELLNQMVGTDKFHVEVNVDMDFSRKESTQKSYNPDLPAVRSEVTMEDSRAGTAPIGIPGAITNQPPTAGSAPEEAKTAAASATSKAPQTSRKEATRNYELDTQISHTQSQVGVIRRMTISVGLDYLNQPPAEAGQPPMKVPRATEELENIRRLVAGAVGLSLQRGDELEVVNFPFATDAPVDSSLEPKLWDLPWVNELLKKGPGWLVALALIFFVLRPVMQKLATAPKLDDDLALPDMSIPGEEASEQDALPDTDKILASAPSVNPYLPGPLGANQDQLSAVKTVVGNEPAMVAQMLIEWMEADA